MCNLSQMILHEVWGTRTSPRLLLIKVQRCEMTVFTQHQRTLHSLFQYKTSYGCLDVLAHTHIHIQTSNTHTHTHTHTVYTLTESIELWMKIKDQRVQYSKHCTSSTGSSVCNCANQLTSMHMSLMRSKYKLCRYIRT